MTELSPEKLAQIESEPISDEERYDGLDQETQEAASRCHLTLRSNEEIEGTIEDGSHVLLRQKDEVAAGWVNNDKISPEQARDMFGHYARIAERQTDWFVRRHRNTGDWLF